MALRANRVAAAAANFNFRFWAALGNPSISELLAGVYQELFLFDISFNHKKMNALKNAAIRLTTTAIRPCTKGK